MTIAPDRLSPQALTLELAQSKIRELVKDAYFSGKSERLTEEVNKIIRAALKRIFIPSLRDAAYRSLIEYYGRQVREIQRIGREKVLALVALATLTRRRGEREGVRYADKMSIEQARRIVRTTFGEEVARLYGIPLQKYAEDYFKNDVKPVLDRMADAEALDPDSMNYWGVRSTLRNRAEREVRNQWHIDNLEELCAKGVKLVIISAHSDCSERCRPFQGRVFSLDGTSGVTSDGRRYEPIETATDIYTKNGKWKNGLFGFNCRHYAVEYKDGYRFPMPSARIERKQYAITVRQRQLESTIRRWEAKADIYKGVNSNEYNKAKKKAEEWNDRYRAYSRANNRAYYPSRTRLM